MTNKVDVDLDLDRDEIYQLMCMAHERDITLNQLVEELLQQFIDKHKADNEQRPRQDQE
jgi:hypothetical protein